MNAKREAMAKLLFSKAFDNPRDPRSDAYKRGVLDALRFRLKVLETLNGNCPYKPGTAESDAWHAGADEGHAIYRRSLLNSTVTSKA